MKISEFIDYLGLIQGEHGDVEVEIYGSEHFGYATVGKPVGFKHWPEMKNKDGVVVYKEHVTIFGEGHEP